MVTEAINMNIAVLSGKGGTGKTLVSVNMAAIAKKSIYIDCDVEEPNGHLFLKPKDVQVEDICVKIPQVNTEICTGCRKCVEFCKFNALAYIKNNLKVFDSICHSCGGCILVCPVDAFSEKNKKIGEIRRGISNEITVNTGILKPGESSGTPIINKLLQGVRGTIDAPVFIDCPPGSACVVMDSIKDADYCILVSEPTLFGVHNLNMVYELVKIFEKPFGVVLNKDVEGVDNPAEQFCIGNGIKVLGRIPYDNELGTLNSNGEIVVTVDKKYELLFSDILKRVVKKVQSETVTNS